MLLFTFKMQRVLPAFLIIQLCVHYWKIFVFIMLPHQVKKMVHQLYPKSNIYKIKIYKQDLISKYLSFYSYIYPTIDDLAAQLLFVLSHFGLKSVIGFGVGAGANILARFALNNPDKVFWIFYLEFFFEFF